MVEFYFFFIPHLSFLPCNISSLASNSLNLGCSLRNQLAMIISIKLYGTSEYIGARQ